MTTTTEQPPAKYKPGSARAALAYRNFRIVFIGTALSSVGTWMQNFTLPAYIDSRTGSAGLVGLLVFVQLGPLLLLSLPAGVLADKVRRTQFVIAMQTVMLTMSLVLAVFVATETPLWTIFAVQLVIGVANALNAPAFSASTPMMVDRVDLAGAVSLNSAMINGSRIMGPAIAALLAFAGLSTAQLFIVNAATYLFLIVPLLFIALPQAIGNHPERGWRRLTSGINIARRREVLWRSLTAMCLFSLISLPYVGLFPSVARLNFNIDSSGGQYKLLYIVWGLGAFLGALSVGTILSGFDKKRLTSVGFAGFSVALAVFALFRDIEAAYFVAMILGFLYFMTATTIVTVFQQNTADTERGAVMPLWFMAFGGTVPIGNMIAGPIMDHVGARPVLLVGAGFAMFLAWWADLHRLPEEAFLPEELGGEAFKPANASRMI